ncbi:MAG: FHA domain-containing protein [Eggerthellaceae bacterium]|nr:FHA domain-containing protein [Eggerthellaceae bacterium]
MVLFVAAGCTADVRRAVEATSDFMRSAHGGGLSTPAFALMPREGTPRRGEAPAPSLGLLRVVDGYVCGAPHWVAPDGEGAEIGALSFADGAVTDVGEDVSGRHARLWNEDGAWLVEGLGSTNGTVLVSAADGSRVVVEPPARERAGFEPAPVEVRPGDQLLLGGTTAFLVLEGSPDA